MNRAHFKWLIPALLLAALAGGAWFLIDGFWYGDASRLHRAILRSDESAVKRLIADGADVNARMHAYGALGDGEATPLHLAASRGNAAIADALIRAGAKIDAVDNQGYTALQQALFEQADDLAQALIGAGCDVRRPEGDAPGHSAYWSPLVIALDRASIDTVRAMIAAGAIPEQELGESAIGWVGARDLIPKVRLLMGRGLSVSGSDARYGEVLHAAARANDAEAVGFLLGNGCDIESRSVNGYPPLFSAAGAGANDAVVALLDRGANGRASAPKFGSAIYVAAFHGRTETVRLLLSRNLGIDLQAGRASDQATPLHFAYSNGDREMARLLLDAGADPDAKTSDGRRPEQFSRR